MIQLQENINIVQMRFGFDLTNARIDGPDQKFEDGARFRSIFKNFGKRIREMRKFRIPRPGRSRRHGRFQLLVGLI